MKKFLSILVLSVMLVSVFVGCKKDDKELEKIIVGASPTPHVQILEAVREELKGKGYELVIKEFTDYIQPNLTLESKELDANYFQHLPYLEDFNLKNKTNLVPAAFIHYEPFGMYAGRTENLADIKDGAMISVPNDTTNEARALLLLEAQGLIKLKEGVGLEATPKDIAENPKNLVIKELEAAQIPRSLPDVDFGIINGNNALLAGLNAATDAVAKEEKDSLAAETFANVIAVRAGDEENAKTKALVEALKSEAVRKFIEEEYKGAVVPAF